jgi:hypothetical protein
MPMTGNRDGIGTQPGLLRRGSFDWFDCFETFWASRPMEFGQGTPPLSGGKCHKQPGFCGLFGPVAPPALPNDPVRSCRSSFDFDAGFDCFQTFWAFRPVEFDPGRLPLSGRKCPKQSGFCGYFGLLHRPPCAGAREVRSAAAARLISTLGLIVFKGSPYFQNLRSAAAGGSKRLRLLLSKMHSGCGASTRISRSHIPRTAKPSFGGLG